MKPLSKYYLMLLLGTLAFGSCRKDARQEPNERPIEEAKTVTLSLSAEVGFEEESVAEGDLKGLNFKLEDVNGKNIPRPQFNDGADVEVVTVVKSNKGETYVQKMQWRYVSATRSLKLERGYTGNDITIPNFNNSEGKKWYIAGLLAPESMLSDTNNTQVSFSGTHVLKEMTMTDPAELNVPYWTGWMELLIESFPPNSLDGSGSYSNAKVQTASATFRPLGTLIKYELGNKLTGGSYTFTPSTGFIVRSNAFSDKGTFDFENSTVPTTNPQSANPKWEATQAPMVYSFALGHAPSAIVHNGTSSKVYYAWVMSYETQPTTVETRVLLKGTSSKYTAHPERDITKTYYTDYTTRGKASGGKPQHGKIQLLRANATQRVIAPIEYMTEYNLAGGGLLTSVTINHVRNQKPEGIKGDLRFSNFLSNGSTPNPNPHRNDQSGYYTWYELMGITEPTFNPSGKSLQNEVNRKWSNQYFVPEIDHLWGVFPSKDDIHWTSRSSTTKPDYLQLGYNQQKYYHSQSEYSQGFTLGSSNETSNAVIYAIRFKAASDTSPKIQDAVFYNLSSNTYEPRTYQPLVDNSLRCAYRYTRVGGKTAWDNPYNNNFTSQTKIDVVYLGDADVSLVDISNQSWWEASSPQRNAKGLGPVLSRTIPAPSYVQRHGASDYRLHNRGFWGLYWSANASNGTNAWNVYVSGWGMTGKGGNTQQYGISVRLFKRDPDAQ